MIGSSKVPSGRCVIVDHGKPSVAIVVPRLSTSDPAYGIAVRAATILQSSIRKMTGCELQIKTMVLPGAGDSINIGFPEPKHGAAPRSNIITAPPSAGTRETLGDHLIPDGFGVYTEGTSLFIASGGRKGAIYGVVNFLERHFGCRCYSPTAYVFPKVDSMVVDGVFEAENPAVDFRAVNGDFSKDADYLDWTRGNATDEQFGRGFYVHTFSKLVPFEINFAGHPDYFAFMNGRRVGDQLCPSNPAVVPLIVAKLRQEMAAQPDKHVWSVSQNDNESFCHCPLCLKVITEEGAPSGPLLRMVNQVARQFPKETISTLAYEWSRKAPKMTKPDSNVQIMLCTIEADRSMPISENPTTKDFMRDLFDWTRLTTNLYLWDYTVDFSHQVSPFPNLRVLDLNLQLFVGCGVKQIFEQTNTSPGHEFSELKAYLLSKLMWNPYQDDRRIVHEFCQGYYGPAAPYIEGYIDELHNAMEASRTRLDIFESPVKHANDFLSERHLSEYGTQFYLAKTATAGSGMDDYRQRVLTAELPLEYARIVIGADDIYGPRGFYTMQDGKPVARISIPGTFDLFADIANQSNVRSINEKNLTPQQFRDSLVQMTTLDVAGNHAFGAKVLAKPQPSKKYAHGDLGVLTNGVHGGTDFNAQWVGWDGVDAEFMVDLGGAKTLSLIETNSLSNGESWVLHPNKVECFVSVDGKGYLPWGKESIDVLHKNEARIHHFSFANPYGPYEHKAFRYVMFRVTGAKKLPSWHPWAGGSAWVFLDEVVIR